MSGILDGKRILVAGVTMDSSIGFATAKVAQEQGATVLISNFGRALGITRRIAKRLPSEPPVLELDVTDPEHLERLPDLVRYLRAIEHRLDKVQYHPQRDREWMYQVDEVEQRYRDLLAAVPEGRAPSEALLHVGWMIEELRVSLFAQDLGTAYSVSEKRVRTALNEALAETR